MSTLAIIDLGPSLVRYWDPPDGSDLPADPLAAVDLWLDDIRGRMATFSTELIAGDAVRYIGYDYVSRKWRCLLVSVWKERI